MLHVEQNLTLPTPSLHPTLNSDLHNPPYSL